MAKQAGLHVSTRGFPMLELEIYISRACKVLAWWGRSLATVYPHDKPLERNDDGLQNTATGLRTMWDEELLER